MGSKEETEAGLAIEEMLEEEHEEVEELKDKRVFQE